MNAEAILYRQRVLPAQLERARNRVRHLEAEAARYGMTELIQRAERKAPRVA